MDTWLASAVFLVGAASGALLTLIARSGLKAPPILPASTSNDQPTTQQRAS